MREINSIIVHCSDSKTGSALEINSWHLERGWEGIGYHFVIGAKYGHLRALDGNIEVGRPLPKQGAHAKGHNEDSIGICLIGKTKFTLAQYESLKRLCIMLMDKYNIDYDNVLGHYEVCDNRKPCPCFNMSNFRDYLRYGRKKHLNKLVY